MRSIPALRQQPVDPPGSSFSLREPFPSSAAEARRSRLVAEQGDGEQGQ